MASDTFEISPGLKVFDTDGKNVAYDGIKYTMKQSTFIPLIVTILGLTVGAGVLIGRLEVEQVRADWGNRRCEPSVLFSSFLYKPPDYPASAFKFAANNFDFCSDKMVDDVFKRIASMFTNIVSKQSSGIGVIHDIQKALQRLISIAKDSFVEIMDPFYKTYTATVAQVARISHALRRSIQRINAIIVATLYSGLSMLYALLNSVDFIIKVILIILGILVAIVLILFLFFFPVIPGILAVISALVIAGLGASVGGMAATFCFANDTYILLQDGTTKKVSELISGDVLLGHGTVQGMYRFTGECSQMYNLYGNHVTGDHLVWKSTAWIPVSQHPDAVMISERHDTVYCPIISNRCVPVLSLSNNITWYRDWEELDEDDEEGNKEYNNICYRYLNKSSIDSIHTPIWSGLLSPSIIVYHKEKGFVPINTIAIGDEIYDGLNNCYTKVNGTVYETVVDTHYKYWMTDGIWYNIGGFWMQSTINKTVHNIPVMTQSQSQVQSQSQLQSHGHHLITSSGTYTIYNNDYIHTIHNGLHIRDALEIGNDIKITYDYVLSRIQSSPPPEL